MTPIGEKPISRFYEGMSMTGTFKTGDLLLVKKVTWKEIHPGDVIVFRKNENLVIAHRVLEVTPDGLVTGGDNNGFPDPDRVLEQSILGIVTSVKRSGKKLSVTGGMPGLLRVQLLRLGFKIKQTLFFIGRRPYHLLRRQRWLSHLWHPALVKIRLETTHGPLFKYIYKRRTVARWWPERHYFECRKPYDLVIPNPEENKQN